MKKYYKIHRANPGFVAIDLIEKNETVGGYLIPVKPFVEGFEDIIIKSIKKQGYKRYEEKSNT